MKDIQYTFCIYCGFAMFKDSKGYKTLICKSKKCYNYTIYYIYGNDLHSIDILNHKLENNYKSNMCEIFCINKDDSYSLIYELAYTLDFSDIEKCKEIVNNILLLK